ncbi:WD40 repeat domain-containing protein [Candidatus Dependentiae bacterium]|nr:WD40 repeat domain-containing protein [Candidatus Dependentiae bacterium]
MGRFIQQLLLGTLFVMLLIGANIQCMDEDILTSKSNSQDIHTPQKSILIKRELQNFVFYRVQEGVDSYTMKELGRLSECSCNNILMLMHFNRLPSEVQRLILSLFLKDLLSHNFRLSKTFSLGVSIHSAKFTPRGAQVLTKPSQGVANLWTLIPEDCLELTGYEWPTDLAKLSKDGTKIITISNNARDTAHIWNATTGECLLELKKHLGRIGIVKFSSDGTRALTGSADSTVCVWDTTTGACLTQLKGHTGIILFGMFSPNGTKILTKSEDMTIRLWETTTGSCLATLTGKDRHTIFIARFSPDNTRIACGSENTTTSLWNSTMDVCLRKLKHLQSIFPVKFSNDSTKILTLAENFMNHTVWDTITGELLVELKGHTRSIYTAKFSPDGTLLITGSEDKTIRLWDAITGKCIRDLLEELKDTERPEFHSSIKFSSDGTKILIASDQNARDTVIRLWDLSCEAYEWIVAKANLFQAALIAKALEAKQTGGFLVLNEHSPEHESFMSLPSFVQDYIKTSYSLEVGIG